MNRRMKQLVLALLCGLQLMLFQNCSDARFTNVEDQKLGSFSCQTNLIDSTRTVKILLLVDASGSNVPSRSDAVGTDPEKRWRLEAINSLVNRYGSKNNIHFGLATFRGSSSQAQIRGPNGQAVFSNSQAVVQEGIQNFKNMADADGTPYKAALDMAKSLIQEDLKSSSDKDAVYSVVMVSDGMPLDYSTTDALIPDVAAITSLAEGKINISSIFYYSTSNQLTTIDTKYLKTIATIGKGSFASANANQSIDLQDTIKVPHEVCQ